MGRDGIRLKVVPRFDLLEVRQLLSADESLASLIGTPKPAASSPVLVALVDSGIDANTSDPIHYQGAASLLDWTDAYDAVTGTYGQAAVADSSTTLLGTKAASNVALGISAGTAAGGSSNVQIVPIRIFDPNLHFAPPYALVNGIYHAIDIGAKVIDIGYVGSQFELTAGQQQQLNGALQDARSLGIAVVVAAGNGFESTSPVGVDIDKAGTFYGVYPADSHLANMLVVTATSSSGQLASTANWGTTHVDLGSPTSPADGDTASASGYVAGVAGVLAATRTDWTGFDVVNRIKQTVQPSSSLAGKVTTGGLVNPSKVFQGISGVYAGHTKNDYEGDLKSDLSLYANVPGVGYSYAVASSTQGFSTANQTIYNNQGVSFGGPGSIPVPGRYYGGVVTEPALLTPERNAAGQPTGKFDFAVLGQDASGNSYVIASAVGIGSTGDVPVAADFTGSGHDDLALYGLHNGQYNFQVLSTASGFDPSKAVYLNNNGFSLGGPGSVPVVGNFFGDGVDSPGIYGPDYTSTGQPTGKYAFAALDSGSLNAQYHYTKGIYTPGFGAAGNIPIVGDYDGDGKSDLALYGNFGGHQGFAILASTNNFNPNQFVFVNNNGANLGTSADIPVAGDFFGNGISDPAIYGPSIGANGQPDGTYRFLALNPGSINAKYQYTQSLTIPNFGGSNVDPTSAPPAVRAQKAASVS